MTDQDGTKKTLCQAIILGVLQMIWSNHGLFIRPVSGILMQLDTEIGGTTIDIGVASFQQGRYIIKVSVFVITWEGVKMWVRQKGISEN